MAPVHLKARRTPAGIRLTWVRRTRRDGDAWEPLDIPLGEERESYEIDVLRGSAVARTLVTDTPAVLYPPTQEMADFGPSQPMLTVSIAQTSAAIGRGFTRTETIVIS